MIRSQTFPHEAHHCQRLPLESIGVFHSNHQCVAELNGYRCRIVALQPPHGAADYHYALRFDLTDKPVFINAVDCEFTPEVVGPPSTTEPHHAEAEGRERTE